MKDFFVEQNARLQSWALRSQASLPMEGGPCFNGPLERLAPNDQSSGNMSSRTMLNMTIHPDNLIVFYLAYALTNVWIPALGHIYTFVFSGNSGQRDGIDGCSAHQSSPFS